MESEEPDTDDVGGQGEDLTARVILPRREAMDIYLAPSHWLERLEEYHSDENAALMLTGTFLGLTLGILSNWLTNESFSITRASIVIMAVFAILTLGSLFWARSIRRKVETVRKQIFSHDTTTDEKHRGETR